MTMFSSVSTLTWITGASLAGGILSVLCAALFALTARAAWVSLLVSYAVGALLGAAFLEMLPQAFSLGKSAELVAGSILAGILLFFILEKLVLWRHCHTDDCEVHGESADHGHPEAGHDRGRSGLLILVGDTIHNFVDGVLIAAAFMAGTELGIVTAVAIIAHEIPQEVGDFLVLLHSGYSRARALAYNLLSSVATFVGAFIAYFALQPLMEWLPVLLGIAAASMIYVAVADLIPGLHRRPEIGASVSQVVLISAGILSIWLVRQVVAH
jgi:zinc and cadmium transporter